MLGAPTTSIVRIMLLVLLVFMLVPMAAHGLPPTHRVGLDTAGMQATLDSVRAAIEAGHASARITRRVVESRGHIPDEWAPDGKPVDVTWAYSGQKILVTYSGLEDDVSDGNCLITRDTRTDPPRIRIGQGLPKLCNNAVDPFGDEPYACGRPVISIDPVSLGYCIRVPSASDRLGSRVWLADFNRKHRPAATQCATGTRLRWDTYISGHRQTWMVELDPAVGYMIRRFVWTTASRDGATVYESAYNVTATKSLGSFSLPRKVEQVDTTTRNGVVVDFKRSVSNLDISPELASDTFSIIHIGDVVDAGSRLYRIAPDGKREPYDDEVAAEKPPSLFKRLAAFHLKIFSVGLVAAIVALVLRRTLHR